MERIIPELEPEVSVVPEPELVVTSSEALKPDAMSIPVDQLVVAKTIYHPTTHPSMPTCSIGFIQLPVPAGSGFLDPPPLLVVPRFLAISSTVALPCFLALSPSLTLPISCLHHRWLCQASWLLHNHWLCPASGFLLHS